MANPRTIPPAAPDASTSRAAPKRGHTVATTARRAPRYFSTTDPRLAWEHFRPLALRVEADDLAHFRYDPQLASHNVRVGLAAVEPRMDELQRRDAELDPAELLELPSLALALGFAAARVPAPKRASKGEIEAKVTAISRPRELTLRYLEVVDALEPDLFPPGRIAKIRNGKGRLDMAQDCVQIAAVFHEHAAKLAGRHPFTAEYIAAMAADGAWLLGVLRPGNAKAAPAARTPESIERDRFARLLEERYDKLRTAGVMLFGIRSVDAKVPPLYSGTRATAGEDEAPADGDDDPGDDDRSPDA